MISDLLKMYYFNHFTSLVPWCDGHSTIISTCRVWGVRVEIQASKKEFHTHIHLNYIRVKFYLVKKKKKSTILFISIITFI